MSDDQPVSGSRPPAEPVTPWGIPGTLVGLLPVLGLTAASIAASGAVAKAPQDVPEGLSLAARYGAFVLFEMVLAGIALLAVIATRSRLSMLGVRAGGVRPAAEGLATGLGLVFFNALYSLALERFAPETFARMSAEQAAQMKFLEGPWPLIVAAAALLAPICEEVYFRGFVFGGLRGSLGFPLAAGLSAAVFSAIHVMWYSIIPLFLVGLGAAILYERHRTLLAPVAMHAAFNAAGLAGFAMFGQ